MKKAKFHIVDRNVESNIVFLHDDSEFFGTMTITNDAENVVTYCRELYGNGVRVVYKDTCDGWWEIEWISVPTGVEVTFTPWHGLVWDKLCN